MTVTVELSEQLDKVWFYYFQAGWTWEEVFYAFDHDVQWATDRRHDAVVCLTAVDRFPKNSLANFVVALQKCQAGGGKITVLVSKSMFLRTLFSLFVRMYHDLSDSVWITDSIEKAITIITTDRAQETRKSPV